MTTTWDGWFNDATAWISETWTTGLSSAAAVLSTGADVLGVATACLLLMAVVPVAVHLAWLVILVALGAPVWFVLTLVWH